VSNIENREEEHRTRFEQSIKDLLRIAKSYYETNKRINIIVVGVGLVFLANAIAHTWIQGVSSNDNAWLGLASGGLSVATFVALFFSKSQENITKAFGNLAQIQMIYKAYCLQFDSLLDFHLRHEYDADLTTIANLNSEIETIATNGASLVQANLETEESDTIKTESMNKTVFGSTTTAVKGVIKSVEANKTRTESVESSS
jgi:hypothetical protein